MTSVNCSALFGFNETDLFRALEDPSITSRLPAVKSSVITALSIIKPQIARIRTIMQTSSNMLLRYKKSQDSMRTIGIIRRDPTDPQEPGSYPMDLYLIFSRYISQGDPLIGKGSTSRACLALHLSNQPTLLASLASLHPEALKGLEIQRSLQKTAPLAEVIAVFSPYNKEESTCWRSLQRLYSGNLYHISIIRKIDLFLVAQDILRALRALHGEGILHGDLKEDNILLDLSTGRAVLTDFSDSHLIGDDCNWLTHPFYLDPHLADLVIKASGAVSHRSYTGNTCFASDIWALGICFFRILSRGTVSYTSKASLRVEKENPITESRVTTCQLILQTCNEPSWASREMASAPKGKDFPEEFLGLLDLMLDPCRTTRITVDELIEKVEAHITARH